MVLFSSCKSGKEFVYVGSEPFYIRDTIVLKEIHHHYEDGEGRPNCAWVEEVSFPIILEIERPVFKKKRVKY